MVELIENNWSFGYARLETRSEHKSLIIRRIKRIRIMTCVWLLVEGRAKRDDELKVSQR